MKVIAKRFCIFLLAFVFFAVIPIKGETKTVKVGFFAFDGYHEENNGIRSGYGYDYLQEIAKYTNWRYEYVGYDKSWSEIKQMLINGEVDIITSAQETTKFFDGEKDVYLKNYATYSSDNIGYSATILTTYNDNADLITKKFSDYDIKVGVIKGNSRNDSFVTWANENDVTYELKEYNTIEEVQSALNNKTIDTIVSSSLRKTKNETLLSEFDYTPFYAVVNDDTLSKELNKAIKALNMDNPYLYDYLFKKNYRTNNNDILLTKEEKDFITNNKNIEIKAYLSNISVPFSYVDDDTFKGIIPKIFDEIKKNTGLNITLQKDNAPNVLKQNEIILDGINNYNIAESKNARISNSYLTLEMSKVYIDKNRNDKIGFFSGCYKPNNEDYLFFDSLDSALRNVLDGNIGALYTDAYTAEYIISMDKTNKLSSEIIPEIIKINYYVSDESDPLLLSIINKSIDALSEEDVKYIINDELTKYNVKKDIVYYMYNNPELVVTIIVICFVAISLIIVTVISFVVYKKEKNLNLQNARYEEILSGVYNEILELNLTDDIKYSIIMNQKRMNRFIIGHARFDKNSLKEIIFCDDLDVTYENLSYENLKSVAEKKLIKTFDCRLINLNGVIKWYTYIIQGVETQSNKLTVMLYKKDINEYKKDDLMQKEALRTALISAQEAEKIKTRFLSTISHELRTSLNAIVGYLELMKDIDNIDTIRDYIKKSSMSTKQLLNIISDILDLDAIETGKLSIKLLPFDMEKLIRNTADIFKDQAKAKGLAFNLHIDDVFYELLIGDETRIRQVLYNILSNAVKYTMKGSIDVSITKKIVQNNNVYVHFEVADTGIGMDKETLDSLYEPFARGKVGNISGTGLGLPVTKSIVSMLKGSIIATSEVDKGSTFIVEIPLEIGNKLKYKNDDYKNYKCIIIDQNQAEVDYLGILLNNIGCAYESISDESKIYNASADLYLIDDNVFNHDINETISLLETNRNAKYVVMSSLLVSNKSPLVDAYLEKPIFQSSINELFEKLISTKKKTTQKRDYNGLKALVVEDNLMNSEIAQEILKKANIVTSVAFDGQMAVEKVKNEDYDLILMDIKMPVMDGLEATRAIRELPVRNDIPIIGMSANAYPSDISTGLSIGMNDYVSKPIDIDVLFEAIDKILKKS